MDWTVPALSFASGVPSRFRIFNYLKNIRFAVIGGAIGTKPGVTGVSGFPRYGHRNRFKWLYTFNFKYLSE
jgi:hypothetical protein